MVDELRKEDEEEGEMMFVESLDGTLVEDDVGNVTSGGETGGGAEGGGEGIVAELRMTSTAPGGVGNGGTLSGQRAHVDVRATRGGGGGSGGGRGCEGRGRGW